jgi:predicted nucleic acid-binding protein
VISVYVDANVFLYAIGGESAYREPCRALIGGIRHQRIRGETSVTTLEEVVHHRRRRGDAMAVARGREVARICSKVHPLDQTLSLSALTVVERHPELGIGDAIHVATALAHGLQAVVSGDRDFDRIRGIERIDPLDRDGMAALVSE